MADWLADQRALDRQSIVVTHPTIIRAAIVHIMNAPPQSFWRIDIRPLSFTRLSGRTGRWNVSSSGCAITGALPYEPPAPHQPLAYEPAVPRTSRSTRARRVRSAYILATKVLHQSRKDVAYSTDVSVWTLYNYYLIELQQNEQGWRVLKIAHCLSDANNFYPACVYHRVRSDAEEFGKGLIDARGPKSRRSTVAATIHPP